MELETGLALLIQQLYALLKKNYLLSLTNKISVILRIVSSIFFLILLLWVQKSIDSEDDSSPWSHEIRDPKTLFPPPIPPCEDKYFMKLPCFDFVWSGDQNKKIQSIVSKIMDNNPGRPIPPNKVKSFRTAREVDEWFTHDPMHCPAALHFTEKDNNVISYGIETNSSGIKFRGEIEDQVFKFQIPLQIAAEREIARSFIGDPNFSWIVGLKEFARPALIQQSLTKNKSAFSAFGPIFFLALAMFSFVFQISSLVIEKELKLRQAMTMMGLYDTAYWLSWIMWEGIIIILSSLCTVLFGMIVRFDFFLKNSFPVVFLTFFLFQLSMMAFAFMLSTFVRKSSSSTTIGFSIFILSFISLIVMKLGFPYANGSKKMYRIMWSMFPPHPFIFVLQALATLSDKPESPGISWSKRAECTDGPDCTFTINTAFISLASTFFMWIFVAVYLENIIPNAEGVRKPIFYFLNPGYWTGNDGNKIEGGCCTAGSSPTLGSITPDDKDVVEEKNIVNQQSKHGEIDPNVAVQICGLLKSYSGTISVGCHRFCCCFCCPKFKKISPFQAVKGLWMNIAKNQLFCLLGPNGAGKTTTISCLTGITPVTRGDALIYGNSVRSSIGMSNIRKIIGVCPQFDILWDTLSGMEHLRLFASIKGLPSSLIESEAQKLLTQVRINTKSNVRSGSYSGGMKRRLSVAIALIGDPKLVILDEPTTGMDPVTRRHVWDVIEDAKKGRAIVLTTHSMEEADILSDRIGIMAKGRLRCIGTSIRLKSRFGAGFLASVSFPDNIDSTESRDGVKTFFKHKLNVEAKEESKSLLKFVIPQHQEGLLTKFFGELQHREREFSIKDIQLGLTTLEEVFLNIAKKAELEMAVAEGNMTTLTLSSSGASIEVPIGARFVMIPGTESAENTNGVMVEVYWDQNDSGSLCILGHSCETPVPAHAQLTKLPTVSSPEGHVQGILVDF